MPADDEGGEDRLIPTGRGPEEIDDRDLFLHRLAQPAVIRRVRVGAHECVFDDFVAFVDLPMSLALIVIPDAPALSREHGADRKQAGHLPGLEDAALWVDERDALTVEPKAGGEIVGTQDATAENVEPVHLLEGRLPKLEVLCRGVGR